MAAADPRSRPGCGRPFTRAAPGAREGSPAGTRLAPGRGVHRPLLRTLCALLLAAAPAHASRASGPHAAGSHAPGWQELGRAALEDGARAVAFHAESGRLAVGDARGVAVGPPQGPLRRTGARGAARDLAALADGSWLLASERGLFRIDAEGRAAELVPGPADGATIARVAAAGGVLAAAGEDGVVLARDTAPWRSWRRLPGAVPSHPAAAVALRARRGSVECWAALGDQVWRVRARVGDGALALGEPVRVRLPESAGAAPVDLALELSGADAAVLYPTRLLVRAAPAAPWQVLRPELPPGAEARRLRAGAGRVWLATDRGVLFAEGLSGPWRRAAPPAGTSPVHALAASGERVFAASDRGLLARSLGRAEAAGNGGANGARPFTLPAGVGEEPTIGQVHRAAVAYLALDPGRMEALRKGVRRRGWLPELDLSVGRQSDESFGIDHDETFTSGELRRFVDTDRSTSEDWDASIRLTWELGDVAYHPESIDVSREARQVIELRDDVLDEITQLYFERRRVLAELAGLGPGEEPKALRLRIRADELAAGIDAWTGGWFGRLVVRMAP